mgnify:FL=1
MAGNGNRLARVNSELQRVISHVINFELKNTKVTGLVSVTRVRITPDFRYAKVYISIYGSKVKDTLEGLKSSSGFIRTRIASEVNLRITPQLVFEYDDSELHGEKIDMILKKIKEDDMKIKGDSNDNDWSNIKMY